MFEALGSQFSSQPLTSVVDRYLTYYASGSSHTARAKRLDLEKFLQFLASLRGYRTPKKLTVADFDFSAVQRFVDDRLAYGEAPATVSRRLATLKHMGRVLAENVAGFTNPAREVRGPKLPTTRPKALSASQIRALIAHAEARASDRPSFTRQRNLMLLLLLIETGLRADEVRLLKLNQLDEKLEWIKNVRTKGRRYRNVYISTAIRPALARYLELRVAHLAKLRTPLSRRAVRELPLFLSTYRARPQDPASFFMGEKSVWRAIRELSTDTALHPHLLRHSFAVALLESSRDVRLVAQALGHADVRTTMRYTERNEAEVARAIEEKRRRR